MGKTQRAVTDLFAQTIAEAAAAGPTIVLLDEVETLAVDRSKLSLEANPVDIHRATDAVLVQLDALADEYPNLLFLATSNFRKPSTARFHRVATSWSACRCPTVRLAGRSSWIASWV